MRIFTIVSLFLGLADGLSYSDAHGSGADGLAEVLKQEWEDILADVSRLDPSQTYHCWPDVRSSLIGDASEKSKRHDGESQEPSPAPFQLNLTEANLVADLQATIYCNRKLVREWGCTRCHGAVASFELHHLVFVPSWDLTAMVGHWPLFGAIFVLFRGTDSHDLGNWIADMDVRMTDYPLATAAVARRPGSTVGPGLEGGQALVHAGFLRSLMDSGLYHGVHSAVRALRGVHGELPMYVSGHSLGAAMAALAVPMLRRDFSPPSMRLFTFGCPRTGNQAFSNLLMASVDHSVRFTHSHDIVPSLPPPFFGYHHFPREVWQLAARIDHQGVPEQRHIAGSGVRSVADQADPADRFRGASPPHLDGFILHTAGCTEAQGAAEEVGSHELQFRCMGEGLGQDMVSVFKICDGSGEDPGCHDSLCYDRPCTSLKDHIYYLGKHMFHDEGEC